MGDSATGESLLPSSCLSSSSSSGVESLGSAVSNDVCDAVESRMLVEAVEFARERVLDDSFGLTLTGLGESGWRCRGLGLIDRAKPLGLESCQAVK
jgi:hypothetical protein